MKKKLLFGILSLASFSGISNAMEQEPQPGVVTLISAEGQEFTIPQEAAELSGTIKDMLEDMPTEKPEITLLQINTQTLQAITSILQTVNEQVQRQKQGNLNQKNFIFRPGDNAFESANGGFIAQNIQPLVDEALKSFNTMQLAAMVNAANFLAIPFLINAGTRVYVEKTMKQRPDIKWEQLARIVQFDEKIPQPLFIYFKKHFTLKKAGADKELSIADYIALRGQPEIQIVEPKRDPFTDIVGPERKKISSHKKGITSLYGIAQLSTDINILKLSKNYILDQDHDPDFPAQPFRNFSNLELLQLDNNQIKTIQPNIFNGLERLAFLFLQNNQIQTIQPETLNGLGNLNSLHLENNQIKDIKPNTFNGLTNLGGLHLNNNQIQTIQPNTFNGPERLAFLFLQNNQIKTIQPGGFNGLTNLKSLHIRNNQIQTIQPETFNGLGKLMTLRLDNNQIKDIKPNTFNGLDNLHNLQLDNNQIKDIKPNTFNGLGNLETLNLKNNPLEKSAEEIKQEHFPNRYVDVSK